MKKKKIKFGEWLKTKGVPSEIIIFIEALTTVGFCLGFTYPFAYLFTYVKLAIFKSFFPNWIAYFIFVFAFITISNLKVKSDEKINE